MVLYTKTPSSLLWISTCWNVVQRLATVYIKFETCFSCHAWDLTIHDLFYSKQWWRTSAIHLGLVCHLLCTAPGFPIAIYISSVYLLFPIIVFVFFTPDTAPLYSSHMVYSLRSHHSVDNHLIITNIEADNHISNRWDCKLVHSIRIPAWLFIFWFILVCFLFYRVFSVFKFYCSFEQ